MRRIRVNTISVGIAQIQALQSVEQFLIGLEQVLLRMLLVLLQWQLGVGLHELLLNKIAKVVVRRRRIIVNVLKVIELLRLLVETTQLLAKRVQLVVNGSQVIKMLVDGGHVLVLLGRRRGEEIFADGRSRFVSVSAVMRRSYAGQLGLKNKSRSMGLLTVFEKIDGTRDASRYHCTYHANQDQSNNKNNTTQHLLETNKHWSWQLRTQQQ